MQNTNELNICALKPIVVFPVLFKYFGTLFYSSSAHCHHSLKNFLLAFLSLSFRLLRLLSPALSHSLTTQLHCLKVIICV